jgi:hypothetical protein
VQPSVRRPHLGPEARTSRRCSGPEPPRSCTPCPSLTRIASRHRASVLLFQQVTPPGETSAWRLTLAVVGPELAVVHRREGGDGGRVVDGVERHVSRLVLVRVGDPRLVEQAVGRRGQLPRDLDDKILPDPPATRPGALGQDQHSAREAFDDVSPAEVTPVEVGEVDVAVADVRVEEGGEARAVEPELGVDLVGVGRGAVEALHVAHGETELRVAERRVVDLGVALLLPRRALTDRLPLLVRTWREEPTSESDGRSEELWLRSRTFADLHGRGPDEAEQGWPGAPRHALVGPGVGSVVPAGNHVATGQWSL